jgi:integrase
LSSDGNLKIKGGRAPKPATYNAYRLDLLSMYSLAIENGKVQTNPVAKVPFLPMNNERKRFATAEEDSKIRAVIRKQCPRREAELDLFVFTGMREDEGWRLRREDVFPDMRLALLRDTKPGTDAFIQLCDEALAAIEQLGQRADGSGFVIPNPPDRFGQKKVRTFGALFREVVP